jgi:hypothetical protein
MKYNFRVANATKSENEQKIKDIESDLLGILEADGVSGLKAEPKFQARMAKLIREVVVDEFSMTDPTPIFTERRSGTLGDTVEFERLISTLRVVKYSPQSHPLVFTPRKAKYTITTAMHELAFYLPLFQILTRQHSVSEYTTMAAEALTRHYVNLTLTAINAACAQGALDMKGRALRTVQTTGQVDVQKASLDAAIRRLGSYNPGQLTIFGSRWALDPIFDIAASVGGDDLKSELVQRGMIGRYRGAKLVALEDDYNEYLGGFTKVAGMDWERLVFVATPTPGAVLLERDLSPLQWEELDSEKATFRTGIRMDHGIMVHKPQNYHVIQLAAS